MLVLSPVPTHAAGLTLHVSPVGNDAWSGRLAEPNAQRRDGPLATLTAARDTIRRERSQRTVDGPVRVLVASGAYQLTEPLLLEPQDGGTAESPVSYEAAAGAKPVFSGGRAIDAWKAREDGLWETHIPAVAAGEWYFEQFWVNGRRATRARSPNRFYHYFQNVRERALDGSTGRPKQAELTIEIAPAVAAELAGLTPRELHDVNLLAFHKWDNTRRRIDALDTANARLITRGGGMKPWNPLVRGTPFYLENLRGALDAPGEWFLSRDGTLLYHPLPDERIEGCEFVAPVLERFVQLRGAPEDGRFVEHLSLKGLAFRHGQWLTPEGGFEPAQAAAPIEAAIMADGVRHVAIEDCEVSHAGLYGVWFRRGCQDVRLERCVIQDLGAGGVRIGETGIPPAAAQTSRIRIADNIIRGGGRVFPCAVGLWIGQSGDNRILHNDIGDMLYTGISVGWRWGYGESLGKRNTIAFNHVHHIGQGVLSDMGGIYTLGPSEGTVVRNNVFHDIYSWSYGGWGLYTDEGSTGILFENNLVYGTKTGGFHQHYGRENIVRNNILAFAKEHQLQATRVENHLSFTFERNIVLWDEGGLFGSNWGKARANLRNNCYWRLDGETPLFGKETLEEWQATGGETGSIVADPLFQDPKAGDFRLRPDSPALKVGFVPFDPDEAGVRAPEEWQRQAREYPWPELQLPPPPPPLSIRDDFEEAAVGTAPAGAEVHVENRGDAIAVTDTFASQGQRSVELRDAPGVQQAFNPHLVYRPGHRSGATRVSFDLRVEAKSNLVIEWRDYEEGSYHTGPILTIRDGALHLAGLSPVEVPTETWVSFEMLCGLGDAMTGRWSLRVTAPGVEREWQDLPVGNARFRALDWFGFVSNARVKTPAFLDNLRIVPARE